VNDIKKTNYRLLQLFNQTNLTMNNLKLKIFISTVILVISIFYISCTKDEVIKQTNTVVTNDQLSNTLSSRMPSVNWDDLCLQEQADFARFLGRLWGDGIPSDIINLTGSKFTAEAARHSQIYDRLKNIFDLPKNNTRRNLPNFWNYWIDALPGNNPGDPQILREAVQDPNFLAGLIDAEGGIMHKAGTRYLIEDQTYAPSHLDQKKGWGLRNFRPGRIVQLFCLLEDVYGFDKTKIRIGTDEFNYNEKQEAIDTLINRYNRAKAMNENPNNGSAGFTVKIFINPKHFDELRSYGYWEKEVCNKGCESANGMCIDECKFRSPAPDNSVNVLTGDFPDILKERFQIFINVEYD